eukprot:858991_1
MQQMHVCNAVRRINDRVQCNKCKIEQPISAFHRHSGRKLGIDRSWCKKCRFQITCTELGFFQNLVNNAKTNQIRRCKQKGVMPPSFTLTIEHLQALYKKQSMMGFYSHIPLNLRPLSNWQASLERIDPSCDYVHDNVVLEALEFNVMCQWTMDKVAQTPSLIQAPTNSTVDTIHHAKSQLIRRENRR